MFAPTWEIETLEKLVPEHYARLTIQQAEMLAFQLNRLGGKREKPNDENSEPPLAEHERFTGEELLFYKNYFIVEKIPTLPETAKDIRESFDTLPEWVQELLRKVDY